MEKARKGLHALPSGQWVIALNVSGRKPVFAVAL
jgi:hypothetical protein